MGVQHTDAPYHCPACICRFKEEGITDITLDSNVLECIIFGNPKAEWADCE